VKELREKSGAPMGDCLKALQEAKGEMEDAFVVLRKRGMASAAKKASRSTNEGAVGTYIHSGGKIGVLLEHTDHDKAFAAYEAYLTKYEKGEDFDTVVDSMFKIAKLFLDGEKKKLLGIKVATSMERAKAVLHLRTEIRKEFLDVRMNGKVGAKLWELINHLKDYPTVSPASAPVASTSRRKRRMSDDSDGEYRPSPIKSLGKGRQTRRRD